MAYRSDIMRLEGSYEGHKLRPRCTATTASVRFRTSSAFRIAVT